MPQLTKLKKKKIQNEIDRKDYRVRLMNEDCSLQRLAIYRLTPTLGAEGLTKIDKQCVFILTKLYQYVDSSPKS